MAAAGADRGGHAGVSPGRGTLGYVGARHGSYPHRDRIRAGRACGRAAMCGARRWCGRSFGAWSCSLPQPQSLMRPTVRTLCVLAVSTVAMPLTVAAAQQVPAGGALLPTLAVSGVGEAQVVPDRARLAIGVQTQASTAAEASSRNARLQSAVIAALRGLGIPGEQIATSGYNVFPEQQYDQPTRRSRIVGYNVQNTVTVELRQIAQVGPALDAVLAKGANLVSSLQFYSSQAEVARRRALQNAIERARADAEVMAAAAGGRVGELLDLSSDAAVQPPRPMMAMAAGARMADSAPTPVSEGTQTINATVSARWRFVPGR